MKKQVIFTSIFLLLLFLFFAFLYPFKKKTYYDNGEIESCYEMKNIFIEYGNSKQYLPNGVLVADVNYKKNILEGISTYYYTNGKIKVKVDYNKGILMNVLEYYDINGNKLDYGTFFNGNGYVIKYYDDGHVFEKGLVKNGVREGIWHDYPNRDNLNIIWTTKYSNGVNELGIYISVF